MRYVSHARTLDELKDEFLSDIQHRIDTLDAFIKQIRPSAAEAARIARAKQELISIHDYWSNVNLKVRKKSSAQ